jgi:hypothetical protein
MVNKTKPNSKHCQINIQGQTNLKKMKSHWNKPLIDWWIRSHQIQSIVGWICQGQTNQRTITKALYIVPLDQNA